MNCKTLKVIAGALLLAGQLIAKAADWAPAAGPLMTRWAKEVSAQNALPEYPRPQMVRRDWLNLNGLWDLKLGDGTEAKILVPYPIESALSGVMKHSDRMTYHRSFEIPKSWHGRRVVLHFGAVDWETKVSVNGKPLGVHRGGYDAFSFDLTDALKPDGTQEITVEVFDPTDDGGQPRGKQTLKPGGIMYTPTSGIWQTVWLEPVAEAHIASLKLVPDLDGGCLRLTAEGAGLVEAVASDGGKPVAQVSGPAGTELKLAVPNPKLWSPDSPHLYDLRVSLKSSGKVVDSVTSYFGMRKIALAKDENGIARPMLNGKFVFQVGPLDQGFWPDGIYTAPTDEALRFDIEEMRRLGFNCVRKHIKVEPDRWYYWCDQLGLMVWQDMPSVNSYGGNQPIDVPQFKTELECLVRNHWNHPSIIMWVLFNEAQGQHDTEALVGTVRALDPSRLIDNASGGVDKGAGDVVDVHGVENVRAPENARASIVGESQGIYWAPEGHSWKQRGTAATPLERHRLEETYTHYLHKFWQLSEHPGISACIYTEITDIEGEMNGLLTYDRLPKYDAARIAAANRGIFPPPPVRKEVVPTSQRQGINWRFTFEQPAADWIQPAFSDATWKAGLGGFGTRGTPGAVVRTEWATDDIWLRSEFEWPSGKNATPVLLVHHDEDVEIYLNGVLAGQAGGYLSDYETMAMTPEGIAALKPGRNVLAVHCHQTTGGQYVDVGICTESPGGK
jgi:hypothetical protein